MTANKIRVQDFQALQVLYIYVIKRLTNSGQVIISGICIVNVSWAIHSMTDQ